MMTIIIIDYIYQALFIYEQTSKCTMQKKKKTSKETNKINSQNHKHNNRGKQEIQFVMFFCLIVKLQFLDASKLALSK